MQGIRNTLPGGTVAVVAVLMVLTAILFWVASAVEKGATHPAVLVQAHSEGEGEGAPAAPEGSSAREGEEAAAGQPEALTLGVNLEASWVPYAVIIETVVLVVALVLLGSPILFVVILLSDCRHCPGCARVSPPGGRLRPGFLPWWRLLR